MDASKVCPLCGTENSSDAIFCKMDRHPFSPYAPTASEIANRELSSQAEQSVPFFRRRKIRLFKSKPRSGHTAFGLKARYAEPREGKLEQDISSIEEKEASSSPIIEESKNVKFEQGRKISGHGAKENELLSVKDEGVIDDNQPENSDRGSFAVIDFEKTDNVGSVDSKAPVVPLKRVKWLWSATTVASVLLALVMIYWYHSQKNTIKTAFPSFSILSSGEKKQSETTNIPELSDNKNIPLPTPLAGQIEMEKIPSAIKMSSENQSISNNESGMTRVEKDSASSGSSDTRISKGPKTVAVKETVKARDSSILKKRKPIINDQLRYKTSEIASNTSRNNQERIRDQIEKSLKKEGLTGITAIAESNNSIVLKGVVKNKEAKSNAMDLARSHAGNTKIYDLIFIVQQ